MVEYHDLLLAILSVVSIPFLGDSLNGKPHLKKDQNSYLYDEAPGHPSDAPLPRDLSAFLGHPTRVLHCVAALVLLLEVNAAVVEQSALELKFAHLIAALALQLAVLLGRELLESHIIVHALLLIVALPEPTLTLFLLLGG